MDTLIKLIDALSKLAWPALAIFVLWRLYPELKKIVQSRSFSIELGGMKLSVQEASDQLRKQIEDLQEKIVNLRSEIPQEMPLEPLSRLADVAENTSASASKRILWVDDVPSNNAYEIAKLNDEGYEIIQAKSTSEAMQILMGGNRKIDLIISDMGRREEGEYRAKAGLMLIKAVRRAGLDIPIYVYSSSKYSTQNHWDVIEAGGNGATYSPVELFELIKKVP